MLFLRKAFRFLTADIVFIDYSKSLATDQGGCNSGVSAAVKLLEFLSLWEAPAAVLLLGRGWKTRLTPEKLRDLKYGWYKVCFMFCLG